VIHARILPNFAGAHPAGERRRRGCRVCDNSRRLPVAALAPPARDFPGT
jgi:hypothetical protein